MAKAETRQVYRYWHEQDSCIDANDLLCSQCNGVYLLNARSCRTLAPPTKKQFNELMNYLVFSRRTLGAEEPLPIRITLGNQWRWDVYRGMAHYHIYKFPEDVPSINPQREMAAPTYCLNDWPEQRLEWIYVTFVSEVDRQRDYYLRAQDVEDFLKLLLKGLRRMITPTSPYWSICKDAIAQEQPIRKRRGRPPYFFDPF